MSSGWDLGPATHAVVESCFAWRILVTLFTAHDLCHPRWNSTTVRKAIFCRPKLDVFAESSCWCSDRLVRSVRRSVYNAVLVSLVTALVLSRTGYGNVTLAGLPTRQLCRLQSVLHAAARIIFSARKFDHVISLIALLQSLLPALGTAYRRLSRQRRHCRLSSDI